MAGEIVYADPQNWMADDRRIAVSLRKQAWNLQRASLGFLQRNWDRSVAGQRNRLNCCYLPDHSWERVHRHYLRWTHC